jgi:hypothetical protein
VLRGAAGVGAAGLAVAAGGGALLAAARPAQAATAAPGTPVHPAADEPLVVYLRDAATGEFEVFHGTRQVRVRDRKLAVQLLNQVR